MGPARQVAHPILNPRSTAARLGAATIALLLALGVFPGAAAGSHRAPASGSLRGVVLDPDDRPVAGARVSLISPLVGSRHSQTDREGRFTFEAVPAAEYEIVAALEGFRADPLTIAVAGGEDRTVTIHLRLSAVTETVVVSAAQIDRPASWTGESLSVLTSAELAARQVESVADALRLVPGLGVTRTGGRGALTTLFPRGGESDFSLVLVDGLRINTFGGGFDFSELGAGEVDRIEVVRGPQSALHGADAIGSVVQIVTKHGAGPIADGLAEGGSFGTSRIVARTQGSRRGWSWSLGGEHLATAGFEGTAPATGERVANDDYRLRQASASAGWQGAAGDIRVRGRYTSTERGNPGPFGSNPLGFYTKVDRVSRSEGESRQLAVAASRPLGPWVRTRMQAGHHKADGRFVSPFGASFSETRRTSLRGQADIVTTGPFGFSFGAEVQDEQFRNTYVTGRSFRPVPIDRRITGWFGEARYGRGRRVFVTGGIRAERITRSGLEESPDPFVPRPAFADEALVSVNPKIAVAWFLAEPGARGWTKLHAGAGTGIRPPDGFEIAFTDNPSLKPERSRSADAGIEYAWLGGRAMIDATVFVNRYDDLIVAVGSFANASRFRTDNISNARARGLELAGAWRARWGLDLRASYIWLDTAILAVDRGAGAPPPFTIGDPLLRRPRHRGVLDMLVVRDRVSAFVRLEARGRVLDVEPSYGTFGGLFSAPGYGVVDAGGSLRLSGRLHVFGRIDNVFDRRYEEAFGFPALGRGVTIGARLAVAR